MKKLNVGFSYILILGMLGFLTGCAGMTQFKSKMTISEDGRTVTMESNIPASGKIKDAEIKQESGKTLIEKIIPPINVEK